MGRPRKQPARITTFNLPITTADRIDDLRLSNRSAWATKVFNDYFAEREAFAEGIEQAAAVRADPAARIAEIPTKQLAAAFLARIPPYDRDPSLGDDTQNKVSTARLRTEVRNFLLRRMD